MQVAAIVLDKNVSAFLYSSHVQHGGISAFGHLLKVNNLELDKLKRVVRQDGEEVTLTTSEFDLLELLMKRAGQPVSREEVAQTIFGRRLNLNDRSIDVHVSNLRHKLAAGGASVVIETMRGIGYRLVATQ